MRLVLIRASTHIVLIEADLGRRLRLLGRLLIRLICGLVRVLLSGGAIVGLVPVIILLGLPRVIFLLLVGDELGLRGGGGRWVGSLLGLRLIICLPSGVVICMRIFKSSAVTYLGHLRPRHRRHRRACVVYSHYPFIAILLIFLIYYMYLL
jgi:hypothetical protein